MDIEQEAQKLEKEIESGQVDAVSEELHAMSKEDRIAVAEQIKENQRQKTSDGMPVVDFYDSGDLKSADRRMDEITTIHTDYDKSTGKRKSEDYVNSDGSSAHWEYNTQTGNSVSSTYRYTDGTSQHDEFDPKTRRIWTVEADSDGNVVEAKGTDGRSRKFHYDEEGKVDQIDGHLGHWDRVDQDGQTAWVNRDTNAVWEGDFRVNSDGNLDFQPRKGTAWTFTRDGQDVRR